MPEQSGANRRKEWNFMITDEGWLWTVRQPDGSEERSPKAHATLKDAADDARAHGFAAWKRDERRSAARDDDDADE